MAGPQGGCSNRPEHSNRLLPSEARCSETPPGSVPAVSTRPSASPWCAPAASTNLKVPLQLLEVAEQFPSLAELADRADNPRILAQQWLLHVLLELRGHMDQVPG